MTQSKAQKAKAAEARAAKAAAADEAKAAEAAEASSTTTAPEPEQGLNDLAPLEPPAETPDETPDETADAEDAGEAADETEEPAEEAPAENPVPAQPSSVALDAPAPPAPDDEDEDEAEAISLTEAAAVRLDLNPVITITGENGDTVDPDECFTEDNGSGEVRARVRLIEHATATQFDRPVKVLLIGEGSAISVVGAEKIKTRIRKQG